MVNLKKDLGYRLSGEPAEIDSPKMIHYINLKLAALGAPTFGVEEDAEFLEMAKPLLDNAQEKDTLLQNYLCPVDQRIQNFLNDYLSDYADKLDIRLPESTFILDRHGLGRTVSLPPDKDIFESDIVKTYRVQQGILHNPKNDRRTTKGSFHIVEGGLPIPADKIAVPKEVFANLLAKALKPPKELRRLPFTSTQKEQAELFVSLLLRPTVCPEVEGYTPKKSLETRFFAPGNLVSNLDFVESIFGNAGDPHLPENDSALDVEHWTGHTGCVILAPHLIYAKKKDLGIPHINDATERQKRDGMYWENEDEAYNGGTAFKLTCRDERGVMVTLIADNYFGYCKKEVKTQIGFSANLFGLAEEEHAGGAIAFPSYDLGEEFHLDDTLPSNGMTFEDVVSKFGYLMDLKPEGHGIDKTYPDIVYVPEDTHFSIPEQKVTWERDGKKQSLPLEANHTYLLPSGYKIHMEKQMESSLWHLIGTVAEGTLCHKPCTVSGGGKSEISKSIRDAMIQGSIFTANIQKDLDFVDEILNRDYGDRFKKKFKEQRPSRPILSPKRSLGSVIKLFTPSEEYTDEYNDWINSIIPPLKDLIFVVKRHYNPSWGENWREHFSVDEINGYLGHELKFDNKKLVSQYVRVGHAVDGSWRIYKTRQDYSPSQKIQSEDDISASVVIPRRDLEHLNPAYTNESVKLVRNCEYRLFQRPDDCIHRGYDKQAESDLAGPEVLLCNFEPLERDAAADIMRDAIGFDAYTENIQNVITEFSKNEKPQYFVSSAHPRIVDGKVCKNPRYLQKRPDLVDPRSTYLAKVATRLFRIIPEEKPVHWPVNAVLPGRRNNPPDEKNGIRPLAVFNPVHYQDLPELFMDFICSVTGKSPSTTGFGSEGALTKGPFNALWPTADLNNTLVSYVLTGYPGFTSAAGYIGPNFKVDHDISLLIPEIWCRMNVEERDPEHLIKNGHLEKLEDFEFEGKQVLASRLGYRITINFVHAFCGRIFNNPHAVFSEEMLKPELQDKAIFADGVNNIVATQKIVADNYFKDGSVESACPPLKALLHIMSTGSYEGKDLTHPDIRAMFTRDYLLKSDWYQERLVTKQTKDIALWGKNIKHLEDFVSKSNHSETTVRLELHDRLEYSKEQLKKVSSESYLKNLVGTIGADPFKGQLSLSAQDQSTAGKSA